MRAWPHTPQRSSSLGAALAKTAADLRALGRPELDRTRELVAEGWRRVLPPPTTTTADDFPLTAAAAADDDSKATLTLPAEAMDAFLERAGREVGEANAKARATLREIKREQQEQQQQRPMAAAAAVKEEKEEEEEEEERERKVKGE